MGFTTERKLGCVESEITCDERIGQYQVLGVPHIVLSRPTPDGETVIREALVDLKLAQIYAHMKEINTSCIDYSSFGIN